MALSTELSIDGIQMNGHSIAPIRIGLWTMEEQEQFFLERLPLNELHQQQISKKHPKKRIEWLAGRYLVYQLSNGDLCHVDQYGKPFLTESNLEISISHSGSLAAVGISRNIIGVDVQKITPQIQRIAHKFLRPEEKACLNKPSTTQEIEQLHVFWGAKEALYKAYGKKQLDFRKHISVTPFEYQDLPKVQVIEGQVQKNAYHQQFAITYQKLGDYMLVSAIQQD